MPGLLTIEILLKVDWYTPLLFFPLVAALLVSRMVSL